MTNIMRVTKHPFLIEVTMGAGKGQLELGIEGEYLTHIALVQRFGYLMHLFCG